MRVFVPRHISGGMFNMNLSIGPLNISIIQLFILALWAAVSLSIWNSLNSAWMDAVMSWIFILPVVLIFIFIAFFKVSELSLIPFIAKLIRTYFFDETKKYQNWQKLVDPQKVLLRKIKTSEPEQKVEYKKSSQIKKDNIQKLANIFE